ncbi:hypothetical protein Tco_1230838, partial [Tanacetum coccineum]
MIIETIHVDFDELIAMDSKQFSSGPGPKLLTPGTISSGLVPNIPFSTPYVPPIKNDWEILFQPMFDEYLNPPPCVDPQVPATIALEPAVSTGTPSSTTIDQDAPSTSTSQTPPETPSPVIPLGVEEADHDIKVSHMDNNPFIETMQDELNEFDLNVFKLDARAISSSDCVMFITLKWIYKQSVIFIAFAAHMNHDIYQYGMCRTSWAMGILSEDVYDSQPDGYFSETQRYLFNQSKYALESIKKYDMETCEPVDTLMVEKSKLYKDPQGKTVDPTHYRGMIGTLCILTANADHAGCQDNRKSTSGSMQLLGDRLVSWTLKKQKCTAISSIEAEYITFAIDYVANNTSNTTRSNLINDLSFTLSRKVEHGLGLSCILSEQTQQVAARDEKWVPFTKRVKVSSTNVRLETTVPQKEETFQVVIDLIKNTKCFKAFTISADVPEIFMMILDIYPRVEGVDFTDVPDHDATLAFSLILDTK